MVGDDDQTIYSWRGSFNGIITHDFIEDFNPTIVKLSLNFRCPSNILNAIIPSIERNKSRLDKNLKSYKEGGILRVGEYSNYIDMVNSLATLVEEDIKKGLSVAILCRVNSDGLMPALILDSLNKFTFTISGEGMTLDSYIGRLIFGIVKLFTDSYSSYVKNILECLFPIQIKYQVQKLMEVCKNNKLSIWTIEDEDLEYSCPEMYPILRSWRELRKEHGDIATLKLVFDYYRTEVFNRDSQFNIVCRSIILSLEALLKYNNYEDASDFLSDIEYINERLQSRRKDFHGNMVRIATVHEYKGKEADSVYVWNDCKDIFPHKESMHTGEELEEERRIHYIACTRARKQSTIMCIKHNLGLFVQEMDLSKALVIESQDEESDILFNKKELTEQEQLQKEMEENLKKFENSQLEKLNDVISSGNIIKQKDKTKVKDIDTTKNSTEDTEEDTGDYMISFADDI